MSVHEVLRWARTLGLRLPYVPGIEPHAAEHFRGDPMEYLAYMLEDGPPIRITSIEQYRELFGTGSSFDPLVEAHLAGVPIVYHMPELRELLDDAPPGRIEELEPPLEPGSTGRVIRAAQRMPPGEYSVDVDEDELLRVPPSEWTPPGEAEGLPQWVEDQIPEACPECGLSQLGALTIRRTHAQPNEEFLAVFAERISARLEPYSRILNLRIHFGSDRLERTMEEYAGQWPPQRR